MSYICGPCVRVRRKINLKKGPIESKKGAYYTCENDECEATYNSFSEVGKVHPDAESHPTNTGLPVVNKDDGKINDHEATTCRMCSKLHLIPSGKRDTDGYFVY